MENYTQTTTKEIRKPEEFVIVTIRTTAMSGIHGPLRMRIAQRNLNPTNWTMGAGRRKNAKYLFLYITVAS